MMTSGDRDAPDPAVFVGPGAASILYDAVRDGGGRLVTDFAAAEALVWVDKDVDALSRHLHPGLRWVQLPDVGVERWLDAGMIAANPVFTSATGCYGHQVAEHALALILVGTRRLLECAALRSWPTEDLPTGRSLRDSVVTIVGAGGIGSSLIDMLTPFGPEVLTVTRTGREISGAAMSFDVGHLEVPLRRAHFVVLAAPSTPQTKQIINADRLSMMRDDA